MPSIFVRRADGQLIPMMSMPYASEDELQGLLERYPELLIGDDSAEHGRPRYLLVVREAGVPEQAEGSDRFSLDHLFLDAEGVPTLVEVKRASDSRIRREVVGQMFDYAANILRYWPPDRLRSEFEARCDRNGLDPTGEIQRLGIDDVEAFWQSVRTNLSAKRLRLVFLADEIPPTLRTIIEFLNEQMTSTEVLGIEVRQHAGEGLTTLVSETIGRTATAAVTKRESGRQWDEASFFSELDQRSPASIAPIRGIYDWALEHPHVGVEFGTGAKIGAALLYLEGVKGTRRWMSMDTNGRIGLAPKVLGRDPSFAGLAQREEFVARVNEASGATLGPEAAEQTFASFSAELLTEPTKLDAFLQVQEWVLRRAVAAGEDD